MSLAGYSLTGWSPPEPVSASPAEKNHSDRSAMPPKTHPSSRHGSREKGAIGGQQIGYQFARHLQRGSIGMALLRGLVMNFAQLLVIHHADFRGLDQHRLQMAIALFGERPALLLARRFAQRAGQPAVAHGPFDGGETRWIAHLQRPAQRRHRPPAIDFAQRAHPRL